MRRYAKWAGAHPPYITFGHHASRSLGEASGCHRLRSLLFPSISSSIQQLYYLGDRVRRGSAHTYWDLPGRLDLRNSILWTSIYHFYQDAFFWPEPRFFVRSVYCRPSTLFISVLSYSLMLYVQYSRSYIESKHISRLMRLYNIARCNFVRSVYCRLEISYIHKATPSSSYQWYECPIA